MKYIYRLPAMAMGLLALATGTSSCGNDDEDSGPECCTVTYSYTYYGVTSEVEIVGCSDGTYTYETKVNGAVVSSEEGRWDDDETATWADLKADALAADGTCD